MTQRYATRRLQVMTHVKILTGLVLALAVLIALWLPATGANWNGRVEVLSEEDLAQFSGGVNDCKCGDSGPCDSAGAGCVPQMGGYYQLRSIIGSVRCETPSSGNTCTEESKPRCKDVKVCTDSICSECGQSSYSGSYWVCSG